MTAKRTGQHHYRVTARTQLLAGAAALRAVTDGCLHTAAHAVDQALNAAEPVRGTWLPYSCAISRSTLAGS